MECANEAAQQLNVRFATQKTVICEKKMSISCKL